MTTDPRAALDRLIAALEAHLLAASRRKGEADPAVVAAYQTLADAFESYDEALYTAYDEVTPFVLYEDAEDGDEDDDEDDVVDQADDEDLEDDDLDDDLDEGDEPETTEDRHRAPIRR
ncbi:MAG TPA: primosomal protein [Kineosporiaceae bacterium]|nr:primosomal protein [Kineosporiaceae bacterium]